MKCMNNIEEKLIYVKSRVEASGSLNLLNINIYAEDFYKDLLNLIGYSFKNTNVDSANSAHIDLIDDENKTVIQVTSRNDNTKITDSIVGFYKQQKYKDYSLKILLIAKYAKNYTTDFSFNGKYNFDHKKDVIDVTKLLSIIKDNFDYITKVSSFLDREIIFARTKTESKEVETIMGLLKYLSDDDNYREFDDNYICDPEQKINNRFKEYAYSFKEEFADLLPIYYNIVPEAKEVFGLDGVRAKKISTFLKYQSNRFLKEAQNDPIKALDNFTDHFVKKLSLNGISSDLSAIRFYLLEELIGCNIFSTTME